MNNIGSILKFTGSRKQKYSYILFTAKDLIQREFGEHAPDDAYKPSSKIPAYITAAKSPNKLFSSVVIGKLFG